MFEMVRFVYEDGVASDPHISCLHVHENSTLSDLFPKRCMYIYIYV